MAAREERVYLASTSRSQSIFEGRHGRSLGRHHGRTLLTDLFSYKAKDNPPRDDTAHDELGLLTSISNEDNAHKHAPGQAGRDQSSMGASSRRL